MGGSLLLNPTIQHMEVVRQDMSEIYPPSACMTLGSVTSDHECPFHCSRKGLSGPVSPVPLLPLAATPPAKRQNVVVGHCRLLTWFHGLPGTCGRLKRLQFRPLKCSPKSCGGAGVVEISSPTASHHVPFGQLTDSSVASTGPAGVGAVTVDQ
jgi:hypothetical protein